MRVGQSAPCAPNSHAHVVLLARTQDRLEDARREIMRAGGEASIVVGDVANPQTTQEAAARAESEFRPNDVWSMTPRQPSLRRWRNGTRGFSAPYRGDLSDLSTAPWPRSGACCRAIEAPSSKSVPQ